MADDTCVSVDNNATFAGFPRCQKLEECHADIAILGIPYSTPDPISYYGTKSEIDLKLIGAGGNSRTAPSAIREHSSRYRGALNNHDFDLGGDLFAGREIGILDCGDIKISPGGDKKDRENAEVAVRMLLDAGALPIVLGGDHATSIPVLRAYSDSRSICVVQIDAHLDWRDEICGNKEGLSSPMRRASEMPWVASMIQIGLRGTGSARREDVDAALDYGSVLVSAEQVHNLGVEQVLAAVPPADKYYITLDADGLDPSLSPGVFGPPAPGGITYYQILDLMRGIAQKGEVVGLDYVEVVPYLDVGGLTAQVAARIVLSLIGILAHQGQIPRR